MDQVAQNLRGFLARVDSAKYKTGEDALGKEFQEIKSRAAAFRQDGNCSTEVGARPENLKKNRYKDILPYDQTRVPVTLLAEEAGSDYINASFIQGVDKHPRYIATQGPLSHTVMDFWRMIWQYNVKVIVMACRDVEQGKKKCERYWPLDQDTVQYGAFTVSTVSKFIVNAEVVFRNLRVMFLEEVRELGHFQYIAWPDRGIPDSYACFLEMIQLVRQHQGEHKAPMCVHCSAGCGRTGVICTVEYIQCLLHKQKVPSDFSIFEVVMEMRRQRPSAVQTREQYDFLYHAITEMFEKQLKENHNYENLKENKTPFYDDVAAVTLANRTKTLSRPKELGLRVSLPPPQSEMNNTYAVVNKKPTAQGPSPGSNTLNTRSPSSSHVQYDNVRPRSSPTTPVDQLYTTVVPKANRMSTVPSNPPPISSSYSLAGNPSPSEVASVEYSQVSIPSTVPSNNHLKIDNKWSQSVSSAYTMVSDSQAKSQDYEIVTDASKGRGPTTSGIGFNFRVGKPKGPRDPPAEWSR